MYCCSSRWSWHRGGIGVTGGFSSSVSGQSALLPPLSVRSSRTALPCPFKALPCLLLLYWRAFRCVLLSLPSSPGPLCPADLSTSFPPILSRIPKPWPKIGCLDMPCFGADVACTFLTLSTFLFRLEGLSGDESDGARQGRCGGGKENEGLPPPSGKKGTACPAVFYGAVFC